MTGVSGDRSRVARDRSTGSPFAGEGAGARRLVARAAVVLLALATSACTPYKARDKDPNEGGGSSMYRTVDFEGTYR
jgi:hypothetical protein